jgi:hypothetical protein
MEDTLPQHSSWISKQLGVGSRTELNQGYLGGWAENNRQACIGISF